MITLEIKHIIHIIITVQSVFFAVQLLTYKNLSSKSGKIIGVMMIVLFLYYIITLFGFVNFDRVLKYFHFLLLPLLISYIPFYYIYVKSLTVQGYQITAKLIKHFIPACIIFILSAFLFFLLPSEIRLFLIKERINTDSYKFLLNIYVKLFYITTFIYFFQIIFYVTKIIKLLARHSKNIKDYFSYENNISLNWLKLILGIIIFTSILDIVFVFAIMVHLQKYIELVYYFSLFLSLNFWGYFGLKQKDIYIGLNSEFQIRKELGITLQDKETISDEKKDNVNLTEEDQIVLYERIIHLLDNEKLFLDPNLTIQDIAVKLNINKTYLSKAINNIGDKNFKNLINEYRIKEAIQLFSNSRFENISTEGIGLSVGYISKSTFNTSFKHFTGKTPATFRKEQSKNM